MQGFFKINVDAFFVYNSKDSKSGMVGHDSMGRVLFSVVSRFDSTLSLLHAELNIILDGLILAEAQSLEVIEVESYSLVGVQDIYKESSNCL